MPSFITEISWLNEFKPAGGLDSFGETPMYNDLHGAQP